MVKPAQPPSRRHQIFHRVLKRTVQQPGTNCWLWQGPDSGNGRGGGYPRMSLGSRTVAVHLVMYVHEHGYIPGGKQVDHTCRNRMCVNPAHLELVSHRENQKRRAAAGRG